MADVLNLAYLREHPELILFECVSGSRAYGLSHPNSDTDIKGVFILPKQIFFGFERPEQISDERGNTVFFEIEKFLALALRNNPTCLELFGAQPKDIIKEHPLWKSISPQTFLSKLCEDTFGQYAYSQLKKAKGLNKKILNPVAEERKTILDFCVVVDQGKTYPLALWLEKNALQQQNCGLSQLNNVQSLYALYHKEDLPLRGLMRSEESEHLLVSEIPTSLTPLATVFFNEDGYRKYSRSYAEYWAWVKNRNSARYEAALVANRNYDSKNMMHLFRLLEMAMDIAHGKGIVLERPEKEFLLEIKAGRFTLEELLQMADEKSAELAVAFVQSNLPETANEDVVRNLIISIRSDFYK